MSSDGIPCHTPYYIRHLLAESLKVGGYYNFQTFGILTYSLPYLHLRFLEGPSSPLKISVLLDWTDKTYCSSKSKTKFPLGLSKTTILTKGSNFKHT